VTDVRCLDLYIGILEHVNGVSNLCLIICQLTNMGLSNRRSDLPSSRPATTTTVASISKPTRPPSFSNSSAGSKRNSTLEGVLGELPF
jgi:hypothetical protein